MIGAGQLAQMSVAPATSLGVRFTVLANNAEEPAAQVVAETVLGSKDDPHTVLEFARSCDVVTFDHELLTPEVLGSRRRHLEAHPSVVCSTGAGGVRSGA